MELFEVEVSDSGVVPLYLKNSYLPECVLGRNHVVMHQIADVLQSRLQPRPDVLFVLVEIQLFDELFPVNQGLGLEFAVVEQKIDLFRSQSDVQSSEGLLEHEVGDSSTFLFVDLRKDLFQGLGAARNDVFDVVDLHKLKYLRICCIGPPSSPSLRTKIHCF
jgi:hypothetical protein